MFEHDYAAIARAVENLKGLPGRVVRFTTDADDRTDSGEPMFIYDMTDIERRIYRAYVRGPGTDLEIARLADTTKESVVAFRRRKIVRANVKLEVKGQAIDKRGWPWIWGLA